MGDVCILDMPFDNAVGALLTEEAELTFGRVDRPLRAAAMAEGALGVLRAVDRALEDMRWCVYEVRLGRGGKARVVREATCRWRADACAVLALRGPIEDDDEVRPRVVQRLVIAGRPRLRFWVVGPETSLVGDVFEHPDFWTAWGGNADCRGGDK